MPFPWKRLTDAAAANLGGLADQIRKIQEQLRGTDGEGARQGLRMSLASLWDRLDADVDELYALRPDERAVIRRYPRKVDRVELVLRQTETAAGEESDDGGARWDRAWQPRWFVSQDSLPQRRKVGLIPTTVRSKLAAWGELTTDVVARRGRASSIAVDEWLVAGRGPGGGWKR